MPQSIRDLVNGWPADAPYAEEALREADIDDLHLIYDSSNYVFLASLRHPEHGPGLGIYKPARGETPLWDFPPRTIHRREVAAYTLSSLLGWDLIPPTVLRDGPHGPGSMQLFIEHDPARHYFTFRGDPAFRDVLVRFAAFDLVANNADRKGGHLLVGPGERIWGIDNGLCFNEDEKLRTVVWDFAGTRLDRALLDDLRRVCATLSAGEDGADEHVGALVGLLDPAELAALALRVEALLDDPVLPDMYPWRCVPWPTI